MKIVINRPVFRCATEEDIFLARLVEVAGANDVKLLDDSIEIEFRQNFSSKYDKMIKEICDMWHTSFIVYE